MCIYVYINIRFGIEYTQGIVFRVGPAGMNYGTETEILHTRIKPTESIHDIKPEEPEGL